MTLAPLAKRLLLCCICALGFDSSAVSSTAVSGSSANTSPLNTSLGDASPAEALRVLSNIDYVPEQEYSDNRDRLDVYLPSQSSNKPILIHFHGGGLTSGSKEKGSRAFATTLAQHGVCVVAPNYRLAPIHPFPAQINDAVKAVHWAISHMQDYGCDISNVFVSGHSAGAYLAALMAVDAERLSGNVNLAYNIKAAVAISPLLELAKLEKSHLEAVWGSDETLYQNASVTAHVGENKIPLLLMFADDDHQGMQQEIEAFAGAMLSYNNHLGVVEASHRDHKSIINHLNRNDDIVKSTILGWIALHVAGL